MRMQVNGLMARCIVRGHLAKTYISANQCISAEESSSLLIR